MLNKGTKIDVCGIKCIFLKESAHLKGLRRQDSLVNVSGLVRSGLRLYRLLKVKRTYDLNASIRLSEQGGARRRLLQHHLVAANSSSNQPTAA